jgi:acetate kinase
MGIALDESRNKEMVNGKQGNISAPNSKVKVLVVPTDEELSIAQQTLQVRMWGCRHVMPRGLECDMYV